MNEEWWLKTPLTREEWGALHRTPPPEFARCHYCNRWFPESEVGRVGTTLFGIPILCCDGCIEGAMNARRIEPPPVGIVWEDDDA